MGQSLQRELPSPPSGWIALAQKALKACIWIVRRPFIAAGWVWALTTVVALVALGASILFAPLAVAVVPAVFVVLSGCVWAQWWLLGRGDQPVVVVSPYEARTFAAREAAGTQVQSIERFLTTDEHIAVLGGVSVRSVSAPMTARDAERLLALRNVILVVRGEVQAGGDVAYFRGEAYYRDDGPDISLARHELSTYSERSRTSRIRRFLIGDVVASAVHEEGGLEMRSFASVSLAITHFRQVAKVLCILLSEKALDRPYRLRNVGILVVPDLSDDDLNDDLQARALALHAETRRNSEDSRALLEDLERQVADGNFGGPRAAAWLLAQWFSAFHEGWASGEEVARAAARSSAAFPEDPLLALNRAGMELRSGRIGEATRCLARARGLGIPGASYEEVLGNIAWAENDPSRALAHYKRAAVHRAHLAWQIGDCHAKLGDRRRALRAYRTSLRRGAFRVPAAENARAVAGWPKLLPTFPGGWRLGLWMLMHRDPRAVTPFVAAWRRLRPEDPYLAPWIGRQALLRGDIRRADEWSMYATRFQGTNQLIGCLDQVAVMALTDHPQAHSWPESITKHREWLEHNGIGANTDAALASRDLFRRLAYLDNQPQVDTVVELVRRAAGLPVLTPRAPHRRAAPSC